MTVGIAGISFYPLAIENCYKVGNPAESNGSRTLTLLGAVLGPHTGIVRKWISKAATKQPWGSMWI